VDWRYIVLSRGDRRDHGDDMGFKNRALGALLVLAGCMAAACGPRHSDRALIGVDAPVALADRPIHLPISGLAPHDTAEVSAAAQDGMGYGWHSRAVFRADGGGMIDLDHARPRSGTYTGVDGMGLFWSMVPPSGDPDESAFHPGFLSTQNAYDVQVSVTAHGRRLAARTLTRRSWRSPGSRTDSGIPKPRPGRS
jgi:hypothetical protein